MSAARWVGPPTAPAGEWTSWRWEGGVVLERGADDRLPAVRVSVGDLKGEIEVKGWHEGSPPDPPGWLRDGPFPRWDFMRAEDTDWIVWGLLSEIVCEKVTLPPHEARP